MLLKLGISKCTSLAPREETRLAERDACPKLVAAGRLGLYHRLCVIWFVEKDLNGHFEASAAVPARDRTESSGPAADQLQRLFDLRRRQQLDAYRYRL